MPRCYRSRTILLLFIGLMLAFSPAAVHSAFAITRSEVIARARVWTDGAVPYDQYAYYDGYRTDCSGYVSYCWAADASYNCGSITSISHDISKDDLQPGDAILKDDWVGGDRHIVLFEGWADSARTLYWCYEEEGVRFGCAVHRTVDYPYDWMGSEFRPIRYNYIEDGACHPGGICGDGDDSPIAGCWTGFGGAATVGNPYDNRGGCCAHRWCGNGYIQDFNGGSYGLCSITHKDGVGAAYLVLGAIWTKYGAMGGCASCLGWPVGNEVSAAEPSAVSGLPSRYQSFENGSIQYAQPGGVAPASGTGSSDGTPDRLGPNQILYAGQYIESTNGKAILFMQNDGNLVLYYILPRGSQWVAEWASNTAGYPGARAVMQGSDGNFVVYDAQGHPRWGSGTTGHPNSFVIMQTDGNLVIYDANSQAVWATYTLCALDALGPNNALGPTQLLRAGEYIESTNGRAELVMQPDGNLVLYFMYGSQWVAEWASNTAGVPGAWAAMQPDGNFVVRDPQLNPRWASGTDGHHNSIIVMRDDGNLVIYDAYGRPIWTHNGIPLKISGMTKPVGVMHWRPLSDSFVADIGSTFGMVRVEFSLEGEFLNPDPSVWPHSLGEAQRIAGILAQQGSWLLAELKVNNAYDVTDLNTKYADFARSIAATLWNAGCRNVIFELSNEPDISNALDNGETYALMANAAATAIRSVSQFLICTGGIHEPVRPDGTGPYEWTLAAISHLDWSKINFFGYHAYQTSPEKIGGYYTDESIGYMRQLLASYAGGNPCDVLMTEMSWESGDTPDETTRAALYARLSLIHIRNGVESAVWFPSPNGGLPSLAYDFASRLNETFGGNPKDYASVTGNASAVGVNVTNIYTDTVGRYYPDLGQIRVAIWLPRNDTSVQYANLTIPSGYVHADYRSLSSSWVPAQVPISNGQITGLPVSGVPTVLTLYEESALCHLSVSPTGVIDLGTAEVGHTKDMDVYTVTNVGGGTLTGSVSVSAPFSILTPSGGSFSLGAGASQVVRMRFAPTQAITYASDVSFTSNGGNTTGRVTATGTCSSLTAPSGATATSVSAAQINLSWQDNSGNETGFKIERKPCSSGTWSQIASVAANVTSYQDTGLAAATCYAYRVRAYNGCGDSAYSNEATAATQGTPASFCDVPRTDPMWPYVIAIYQQGITAGCRTGAGCVYYCPNDSMTRAQMAKFICKAAGKTWLDKATPTFVDVAKSHALYGWIERLADPGSWGGNPPTRGCRTLVIWRYFCPSASVTRGQMAKFLCVARGKTWLAKPTPTFADVPTSNQFYGWIERLADPTWWGGTAPTSGCTPTTFCPGQAVTRAQMAKFVVVAFGIPH